MTGFKRRGGRIAQCGDVRDEPFADRQLVTTGPLILAGETKLDELGVQRVERRCMRHGRQEIGPRKLHQSLDLALVIAFAFAWSAEPIGKQVMADEFGEARVRSRLPSPRIRATAILVLS